MATGQTLAIAAPPVHEWGEQCPPVGPEECLEPYLSNYLYRIGIYGWRKRSLYFLVILLSGLVIINLSLTVWILKVMDFTTSGMGNLRIGRGGIRLEGQSSFLRTLYAAEILSRQDQPLNIESSRNITIHTRNSKGVVTNRLYIGEGRVESITNQFTIQRPYGDVLLRVNDEEVVMSAKKMKVTGEGGVTFAGSVQTPIVRSEPPEQLRLESPTRTLKVNAPQGIGIESRAGDIKAFCLKDFILESREGTIWLDSEKLQFHNLKTALPTNRGRSYPGIYQMCACENGRLFLSSPDGLCQADDRVCK